MEPFSHSAISPYPSDTEDCTLLARIAAGDRHAFDTLYRGYWPRLTRFLDQIIRRPHLVEEVLNDTMLVVWHSAEAFKAQSRVSTWIFAIAYRKAMKALKRAKEDFLPTAAYDEPFADDDPERDAMRKQLQGQIRLALGALPIEQRAVVELTYYHGCPYAEIAQIMECPVDTVKTRMFHARRKLRLSIEAPIPGE